MRHRVARGSPRGSSRGSRSFDPGFSVIEVIIVMAIISIIAVMAIPQLISARRFLRFNGMMQEVSTQLRYARQQAMTQGQVFRFRYNDFNKEILIIDNQEPGTTANPVANNTANDVVVKILRLAAAGSPDVEIVYGSPTGAPTDLSDGSTLTPLISHQVEVIFQPDGSVRNPSGNHVSSALFFYNRQAPNETARAVSVLGAGGRVKLWRYSRDANLYVE